jgi:hypothetical protein
MAGYYQELTAILRENGCHRVRAGKGDHEIWLSPITGRHFTVDRASGRDTPPTRP